MALTTSGQETEWAYSYSPAAHTGQSSVQPMSITFIYALLSFYYYKHLILRLVCTSIHHLSSR